MNLNLNLATEYLSKLFTYVMSSILLYKCAGITIYSIVKDPYKWATESWGFFSILINDEVVNIPTHFYNFL